MPNERDAVRLEAPDDIALRIANEHTDGDSVIGDRPLWVNRDGLVTAIIAAIAAERSASEKRNEELVRELEVARHGWATVLGDVAAQVKFVTSLKAENERLTRAQPIDADANYVRGVRDGLRAYEENWSLERLATERARLARIHDAIVSARAALRPADEPVTQREM